MIKITNKVEYPCARRFYVSALGIIAILLVAFITLAGVFFAFYLYYKRMILMVCFIIIVLLFLIIMAYSLAWVRINENGITLHLPLHKKNTLRWDEICCSGFFHHTVYIGKTHTFYYFSKLPIHWKSDPLGMTNMPRITKDLIIVADQRGLEQVLREYYPKVFR